MNLGEEDRVLDYSLVLFGGAEGGVGGCGGIAGGSRFADAARCGCRLALCFRGRPDGCLDKVNGLESNGEGKSGVPL